MNTGSGVPYALSLFDLQKLDGFNEAWVAQDKEKVEKYLFDNGMDTNQEYEINVCIHRTLCNKVETGPRFVGQERCCKEWLDSGCASLEAHIASCTDASKRAELLMISREGCADRSWD